MGSIRRKLMLAIMLTSTAAVLVTAAAMVAYEHVELRQSVKTRLRTEAELIARATDEALVTGDVTEARNVLYALQMRGGTMQACLHTADGKLFGEYDPENVFAPKAPVPGEVQFDSHYAQLCRPVMHGHKLVGFLTLRADMQPELEQMRRYFYIALAVIAGALVVAVVLSLQLLQLIAAPLLSLTRAARTVAVGKDYGIRVTKRSRDETGELTDAFNQMLDEIVRREADLAASEERYRLLVESAPDGIAIAVEGKIAFINSAGAKMHGAKSSEELVGRPVLEVVHPDFRESAAARAARVMQQREPSLLGEEKFVRLDGSAFEVEVSVLPVTYRGEAGVLAFFRDITERRELERQILEISERERVRIGQDIHDGLCQQLVGITFVVKLLWGKLRTKNLGESADVEEVERLVRAAIEEAREISHALYPVHFLEEGLCAALQNLADRTSEQCSVPCVADCRDPAANVDKAAALHLYRIAQEAVSNAVKHARCQRIRIGLEADDAMLQLTVRDDGIGIADEAIRSGGLGLRIMQYRARMIGGDLTARRAEGGGTILTVRCPLSG